MKIPFSIATVDTVEASTHSYATGSSREPQPAFAGDHNRCHFPSNPLHIQEADSRDSMSSPARFGIPALTGRIGLLRPTGGRTPSTSDVPESMSLTQPLCAVTTKNRGYRSAEELWKLPETRRFVRDYRSARPQDQALTEHQQGCSHSRPSSVYRHRVAATLSGVGLGSSQPATRPRIVGRNEIVIARGGARSQPNNEPKAIRRRTQTRLNRNSHPRNSQTGPRFRVSAGRPALGVHRQESLTRRREG